MPTMPIPTDVLKTARRFANFAVEEMISNGEAHEADGQVTTTRAELVRTFAATFATGAASTAIKAMIFDAIAKTDQHEDEVLPLPTDSHQAML